MIASIGRAALAATVLLFLGCDSDPAGLETVDVVTGLAAAQAERVVEESLYDLSDSYFSARCSDDDEVELLRMEGSIYERLSYVVDGAGQYHVNYHIMPIGVKGTGVDSGHEYRVTMQGHSTSNQLMSGLNGSYRQTLKLVSRESRATYEMVSRGSYNLDADGNIRVDRYAYEISCKL
jgi:hypothetical protein